jgi:hypothetical protein
MPIRYYIPFATVPVAALFLTFWSAPFTNPWISTLIVGYLGWVLTEYVMHRYAFHAGPQQVRHAHSVHHRIPFDEEGRPKLWQLFPLLAGACLVQVALLGAYLGPTFAGGWLLGYCSYLYTHHAIHAEWLKPSSVIRRRHELHHRGWAFNYNLLCPLGDLVFGTYKEPK